ncbi:MAG: hypothetical protein J6K76_00865 [Spirochaetaceae bacterium]|nr:hypothetical protein [Spirochaetaceae bacterium]
MIIECLFFVLCSVFLYGIGLNRAVIISSSPKGLALSYTKSLFASVSTVALSYLVIHNLLVPLSLHELYPFVCILIFLLVSVFIEVLIRLTVNSIVTEFSVSFLCILLAINESLSLLEAVLFALCCITSFYILIPVLAALRRRNEHASPLPVFKNSLILFSLAILILFVLVFDASWLNGGIGR